MAGGLVFGGGGRRVIVGLGANASFGCEGNFVVRAGRSRKCTWILRVQLCQGLVSILPFAPGVLGPELVMLSRKSRVLYT